MYACMVDIAIGSSAWLFYDSGIVHKSTACCCLATADSTQRNWAYMVFPALPTNMQFPANPSCYSAFKWTLHPSEHASVSGLKCPPACAVVRTNQTPHSLKWIFWFYEPDDVDVVWLLPGPVYADIWGDPCIRGQGDTGVLHSGWCCRGLGL